MTAEAAIFICSICGEPAGEICVYCTKDTCRNHRCERCKRCSDCCECEVPLVEPAREPVVVAAEPELPVAGLEVAAPEPEVAVAGPEVGDHSIAPEPEQETVLPAAPEASEEPDL